jgi:hypothetical protein
LQVVDDVLTRGGRVPCLTLGCHVFLFPVQTFGRTRHDSATQ